MQTEGKTIIAVENLANLYRIVKDERLQAKRGGQNIRTTRIQGKIQIKKEI